MSDAFLPATPDGTVGRRRLRALALGVALACASFATASAQTPVLTARAPNAASTPAPSLLSIPAGKRNQKLTMAVGKSMVVDLPGDATEVFVGNPAIANAVVRSARRLYVMAISKGPTTIIAMDRQGGPIATLEINVNGRDVGELEAILKTTLPGNDIRVQAVEDTVILTGSVASAVDAQRAQDIAQAYTGYSAVGGGGASNSGSGTSISFSNPIVVQGSIINSLVIRGQDQVTLKVTVVEVQRDVVKQLGVNVAGSWGTFGNATSGSGSSFQSPSLASQPASYVATGAAGGLAAGGAGGLALNFGRSVQSLVQAYERNGVARVLAEPTVTAISGESARFTAGGTLPISTQSSIDPKTGICTVTNTQQPYGVTLNFTPTVLSEGRISLHLSTEVTEPDGLQAASYACSNQVGFRTRTNSTTVELPSGGSIVTAGLIQQTSKQAIAGMPGLMNLPILGALFRSRDYQRQETELMIIVTPYLAKALRPDQISKPDDGFTDATDPQSWLLGRMNRIYSTADNPELIRNYKGKVGFIND